MIFGRKALPPAYAAREKFLKRLDAQGVRYAREADQPVVRIPYNGEFFRDVVFSFVFDEDGLTVGLRVFSIAKFGRSQLDDAYEFCNRMNSEFRWMRFFVDGDRELTASADAIVTPETCADVCRQLLARAVGIVDAVCKELN